MTPLKTIIKMCLIVKELTLKGRYKETTFQHKAGEYYENTIWQKCGYCTECLSEKSNNWQVRNYYEKQRHEKACFITLTYAVTPVYLIRRDIQLFFKRLRKYIHDHENDIKIRYYGCGEYGTLKGRPHFHAIIYNWIPKDIEFQKYSKKKKKIYSSEILTKIWGKGITTVQEATDNTIPYMSLYTSGNSENKKKRYALKTKILQNYETTITEYNKKAKQLEKTESELIQIKEFNFYSQAIGFDVWLKTYNETSQNFKEYIKENEYPTPNSWLKKMAKYGEIKAQLEIIRRQEKYKNKETIEQRTANKTTKQLKIITKDLLENKTEDNYF